MEEESTSLRDEIKKMNETIGELAEKKEAKGFKLPFRARINKRRTQEGYASICYINENRGIKFLRAQINEGTVMINGVPHLASTDYMMIYKNRPFLIIPAWNTHPFSPHENMEDAIKEKRTTVGYRLLLNTLKAEQIKTGPKVSATAIIILILVIIGVFYFFSV